MSHQAPGTSPDPDRSALQSLLDRQAIWDCMLRYCRGIDRFDRELVISAYHPDAIDDHRMFVGLGQQLADWANDYHGTHYDTHSHFVTNHYVELDGDVAHAETYFLVLARKANEVDVLGGRYIDRFERRNGEWRIAARVVRRESEGVLGPRTSAGLGQLPVTAGPRDRSDISYQRPLVVKSVPRAAAPDHGSV